MRDSLSRLCGSFIRNRDVIKGAFGWESSYLYPICAAIFTEQGKQAEEGRLRRCREILREQTGLFSNFRSTAKLAMISMLAVDPVPEERLSRALQVYDTLKAYFFGSEYLPVAAMLISGLAPADQYGEIAVRTRRIYNLMKEEHPFLTSGEDSVLAAMLALSKRSDQQVVEEMERCYQLLKPEFFSGNAVQSLSHVLALGEEPAEVKCEQTLALFHGLKERGYQYGTGYELATLGVLAMLPVERDQLIDDVIEVDEFLANQKGYGLLGVGRKQRLMHAGMLVTNDYMGQATAITPAALGSAISLAVAVETAMCVAVISASVTAASSSSN